MFKKLLKYDLRYVFKYWWLVAACSTILSVVGGVSLLVLMSDIPRGESAGEILLTIASVIGIILFGLGLAALTLGNMFFICERFYRNFFTDEGYLTFTLPVKRSTLFNSKIITALITNLATSIVITIDILIAFAISPIGEKFNELFGTAFPEGVFAGLLQMSPEGSESTFTVDIVIAIVLIVIFLALELAISTFTGILLTYGCIVVASVVSKKNKIATAIAIYYLTSLVFSGVAQVASLFITYSLGSVIAQTPESLQGISIILMLFIQIGISVALALGLYTCELHMIHKKLNLS